MEATCQKPSASRTVPLPEDRPTLTVDEAAAIIGIGRATAYIAVKNGQLPSITVGRRVLIPTAALRRILELDGA